MKPPFFGWVGAGRARDGDDSAVAPAAATDASAESADVAAAPAPAEAGTERMIDGPTDGSPRPPADDGSEAA